MASTFTTSLRLENPTPGDPAQRNIWGTTENTGRSLVDSAVAGVTTVDVTAGGTITLSTNSGAADQARQATLKFTGTPPGNVIIVVPQVPKVYIVSNSSSHTTTITPSPGIGIAVASNASKLLWCDGTNMNDGINAVPSLVVANGANIQAGGLAVGGGGINVTGSVAIASGDLTVLSGNVTMNSGQFQANSGTGLFTVTPQGWMQAGAQVGNFSSFNTNGLGEGSRIFVATQSSSQQGMHSFFVCNAAFLPSTNACGLAVQSNSSTARSINAAGSINATGTDYAEYHLKRSDCGDVSKGDIVGFDCNGLITDRSEFAICFGVKSTDPSYVGGDTHMQPTSICVLDGVPLGNPPVQSTNEQGTEEFEATQRAHEARLAANRAMIDRIAYAGIVPVNVQGALPGDWIVPMQRADGGIGGYPVINPSLEQLRISVGRVRRILLDGRPEIAVHVC